MGVISDAGKFKEFVTSEKPVIGYLQGKDFRGTHLTGGDVEDFLLPLKSQISDNFTCATRVHGSESSNNPSILQRMTGYKMESAELVQMIESTLSDTNILIAGWLFGQPTDNPREYLCIEVTAWNQTIDHQYKFVYPGIEFTKRVYTDIPGGGSTFTREVLCSGRTRIDLEGFSWTPSYLVFTICPSTQSNTAGTITKELLTVGFVNVDANAYFSTQDGSIASFSTSWLVTTKMDGKEKYNPDKTPKSPSFGPSSTPNGYGLTDPISGTPRQGTFDDTSDIIRPSDAPITSPLDAGFINAYKVDYTDLAHFSQAIFPKPISQAGSMDEEIALLVNALIENKRIDYILDLLIIPVAVNHLQVKSHISAGGRPLQWVNPDDPEGGYYVDGYKIEDGYVDFSCGSLGIEEYWANFLDYSGTKVKLFLPYVGYVDIQPEYIIHGTIGVDYRFNIFDGSFMCFVTSTSGLSELETTLIAQFAGVAAMHIPLQSNDYSNKISGLISAIGTVAAGVATGGVAAVTGGISAAASLANTLIQKPGTSHANGYNASSSFLSHRKPYLLIERQCAQFSEKRQSEVGIPLNVAGNLSECTGFTVADTAHLDTIPAIIEVKERIGQLLAQGIIL